MGTWKKLLLLSTRLFPGPNFAAPTKSRIFRERWANGCYLISSKTPATTALVEIPKWVEHRSTSANKGHELHSLDVALHPTWTYLTIPPHNSGPFVPDCSSVGPFELSSLLLGDPNMAQRNKRPQCLKIKLCLHWHDEKIDLQCWLVGSTQSLCPLWLIQCLPPWLIVDR